MKRRIPLVTRSLKNRLWAIIVIAVAYLVYTSLADFFPQYWDLIGFKPVSRSILTFGIVIILLICLSGLALSDKMTTLIVREGLTGLYNQNYIRLRLEEEIYRSQRYGHPLSILMIDLDKFKDFNDRYGHTAGDHLLKYFSQLISESIRPSDIPSRFGGEEFLVLLPETDKREAKAVAERIQRRISFYPFRIDSRKEEIGFTISIGISTFPEDGGGPEEMITLADMALYQAKKDGRNRVAMYSN